VFNKEKDPLERVHIDLWGPSPVASAGGKQYLMTFTNGGTSYLEVALLADKSVATTLEAFKLYHAAAERHTSTSHKLKAVWIDNGSEFINNAWQEFCQPLGIQIETTIAYSSVQNGVAEWANQTIFDCDHAMLNNADLPLSCGLSLL
jgi:transposase InsO family protein